MNRKQNDIKWQIPRRMLMRTLIPGAASALFLALSNIADAITLGIRVGANGLAAIGIVTPVYLIYNVVALTFGSGGGVTHARLRAEGKDALALAHFRHTILWVAGISLLFTLAGSFFPEFIVRGLAAAEEYPDLWGMCMTYARPLLSLGPVIILNFVLYYYVENDDDPRLAALALTVGGTLDLGLNILLVLVMNRGVQGAIEATLIAQGISVVILVTHFFGKRGILRPGMILKAKAENSRDVRRWVGRSVRTGIPSAVSQVFLFAFQVMVNHLLMGAGRRGEISADLYVAVFDLVMNIAYIVQPMFNATGDALQPSAATFSVERDQESLHYVRRLGITYGLAAGGLLAVLLGVLARPVSQLLGLGQPEQLAAAVPAIRLYLLSTPFMGYLIILIRYYQAVHNYWLAFQGTFLRDAVPLIPITLLLGLLRPQWIWGAFLPAEALAAGVFWFLQRNYERREIQWQYPMCRVVLTNSSHELGNVVEMISAFCEEHEVPMAKAIQLQLAVEEICSVTIQKAFSGQEDEYIQVTLVLESPSRYVLHIRDSAPYFNPLDLRMEKARKDMESSIMDSIGVMMVRKQSSRMIYQNYQGFNTLTVVYE